MKTTEHAEQCAVIQWAGYHLNQYPELALLFAIPNGGQRHPAVALKLQAEGVKPGVPDLCLPVARCGKHGLFIEMKVNPNKTSDEQVWWLQELARQGYETRVAWCANEAIDILVAYLQESIHAA